MVRRRALMITSSEDFVLQNLRFIIKTRIKMSHELTSESKIQTNSQKRRSPRSQSSEAAPPQEPGGGGVDPIGTFVSYCFHLIVTVGLGTADNSVTVTESWWFGALFY